MKIHPRSITLTSCLTAAFVAFVAVAPVGAQDIEMLKAEEQEQIKRMETSLALTNVLDEAAQLMRAQDYPKARARYTSVIEQSTGNAGLADTNKRARMELASLAAIQAKQEEGKKNWGQARNYWQEAQSLDPANPAYPAGLKGVDQKDPPLSKKYPNNPAATPELQEKVSNIQQLLFEGDSFHESGQYQRAVGRYKEILNIDPTNKVARLRIEKTEKAKERAATVRYQAVRQKRLGEVDDAYATPPMPRKQVESGIRTTGVSETRVAGMFEKLENIIIPELNFTAVDVVDAVKYLQDQSKALDPEKTGVNFVLKVNPTETPAASGDATAPAAPVAAVQREVSLDLRKTPLIEVLRFICNLTNLQFKVEEYSVYIFPSTETSDVQVVRSFPVPPSFFSVKPVPTGGTTTTGATTVNFVTADVKKQLEDKGVKFPQGSSASYLTKSAKLIVKNTLDQINLIEQLLAEQNDATTQIEIETKFIDFTEDQFKEFGFNYRMSLQSTLPVPTVDSAGFLNQSQFPNDTGFISESNLRGGAALPNNSIDTLLNPTAGVNSSIFAVSGILMGQGFEMVLRAINSTTGADLMSAPKVTVVNNQKTKIRVVREFIYPTEFEAPEIQTQSVDIGGTSAQFIAVSPSNPSEFETRDVGVIMEVKANATKDRRIDLELVPEVTEFQGFINYGQSAREAAANDDENPEGREIAEGIALTPVFQIRKVETKIQVIDGQTVVMGGFIRNDTVEIEDKIPLLGDIPLLGRLFRSKADRDVKRNLIIFTTARIVNPNGTPKFLTDSEADALETAALPVPASAKTP
jgi:general secretion pathway protein D